MIISDKWRSYELIDASGGEKLERWGKYILVRPDPQVIFRSDRLNEKWERCDAHYIRSHKGGGEWALKNVPDEWEIGYGDMKFSVSPMGFKHTGLFPEQAANWDWAAELIKNAGRSIRVLNLFAYTGAASVSAAK
ncbi:MAG TPA: SAM-dependent methyltransferase, partial [Bacillota bacterium]|nr:SAM-dependent methyltransferase [Bacillota bacterium]